MLTQSISALQELWSHDECVYYIVRSTATDMQNKLFIYFSASNPDVSGRQSVGGVDELMIWFRFSVPFSPSLSLSLCSFNGAKSITELFIECVLDAHLRNEHPINYK